MQSGIRLVFAAALATALTGCNSGSPPPSPQVAPPVDPATLGVSGGAAGAKLDQADRRMAGEAQFSAVESGQRKSWRGKQGSYGFIEPGPEASRSEGVCREYTHTIYIEGRPQTGNGLACKGQNGAWRIVS